jgi:beta-galactosidase/beta-glucuronidase
MNRNQGTSPSLYTLEVKAEFNGQVSSVASSRFGVREVESYTLPSGGRAFSVNGRPSFQFINLNFKEK